MDREKAIRAVDSCFDYWLDHNKYLHPLELETVRQRKADALAMLKEHEAVVRCKDCEHCYFASNRIPSEQNYACGKHGFDVVPDWYCADGERKSD